MVAGPGLAEVITSIGAPKPSSNGNRWQPVVDGVAGGILAKALRPTHIDGLSLLPAGQLPPNPAEILGSDKALKLLEALSGLADVVVIDTPPVLAVTDATVLAPNADGVILVAAAGQTHRGALTRAVGTLGHRPRPHPRRRPQQGRGLWRWRLRLPGPALRRATTALTTTTTRSVAASPARGSGRRPRPTRRSRSWADASLLDHRRHRGRPLDSRRRPRGGGGRALRPLPGGGRGAGLLARPRAEPRAPRVPSRRTPPSSSGWGRRPSGSSTPACPAAFDLAGAGSVHVAADPYALDNCLRLLFGLLAPRHDALMLHATSVIGNNGAHVFTGPAGTSTLTRLAGDRPVLTDGLVLVRREAAGWLAASTPFWAAHEKPGPPRESALSRLWSLLSVEGNEAEADKFGAARLAVVDHTFLPTADPDLQSAALRLAARLADDVPFSDLRFAGGPEAWNDIDAAVS